MIRSCVLFYCAISHALDALDKIHCALNFLHLLHFILMNLHCKVCNRRDSLTQSVGYDAFGERVSSMLIGL